MLAYIFVFSGGAEAEVEAAVLKAMDAENAGDVDAFLSMWTDEGLEQYDVGSRCRSEDGTSHASKGMLREFEIQG